MNGWCRCEGGFDYDGKSARIANLEAEMASPTFWDSPERAQGVVQELKNLRKVVEPLREVVSSCKDL
ncbi:MAG: PCRF domain-containing protein, partial [Planctomycetota bacterium]